MQTFINIEQFIRNSPGKRGSQILFGDKKHLPYFFIFLQFPETVGAGLRYFFGRSGFAVRGRSRRRLQSRSGFRHRRRDSLFFRDGNSRRTFCQRNRCAHRNHGLQKINGGLTVLSGENQELLAFPVTQRTQNISFRTVENICYRRQIQMGLSTLQTAQQIKIDLNKFPIGLGHVVINKNV